MKALSIKQPWASLIAHGIKDIENRTWKTNFRGRIFIHASGMPDGRMAELLNSSQLDAIMKRSSFTHLDTALITSAIIGEVDILDCVENHKSIWAEASEFGLGFEPDIIRYHWVLANPVLYDKPILNVKGKLSFWYPDNDIVECIGCSQKFDSEFMEEDSAGEKYCNKCAEELFPIMQKEFKEMVDRGEIEP